ncbi:MAG: alpha/beta hydrolase-fold protein [Hyphomicrobiaceae bacterium]
MAIAAALLPLMGFCVQAGELRRDFLPSPTLGENLNFVVYLPDGYEASRARYPVLYLLHGAGGDASEWTSATKLQTVADRMIASGEIPPVLIVMPECRGCWWVDSPRANIETAFWADLVPGLARRYRTIESREGRGIAGYSAGGFGAVRFALKYPDKFAAVAAFSPAVYSDVPPVQSMARAQLPFRLANGGFNATMWKARNYPALINGYTRQANRVPMFLVSGDHDKLGIAFETALLFKTMFELQGDSVEFRVVDGGHSTEVAAKALPDALKYLFRHLQKPVTITAVTQPPMASAAVR